MTKYISNNIAFVWNGFTVPAGALIGVDWPKVRDVEDVSGATQDDKEFLTKKRSSTVTVSMWDDVANTIRAAMPNTGAFATGDYYPQGNTTGKPKRSASMAVVNVSDPANHDAGAPITVSFQVSGAVTESTVA